MRGEQACLVEDDDDEEEEENGDHDIGVPVKSRPIGPVPPSLVRSNRQIEGSSPVVLPPP